MSSNDPSSAYAPAPMVHDLVAKITGRYDLPVRQQEADRLLAAEGAGHIVHDLPVRADGRTVSLVSRPWRLDPIPVVIDAAEFSVLGDRVVARMRMLEAILTDLYGARTLLTDRILEPSDVWASHRYRLAAIGQLAAPRWLTTYSVDVAKDTSGRWHVVQDLTDQPPGGGYTFMGRNVLARVHRDVIAALPRGAGLRSIDPFADQLRDALADLANTESPRIVVMSGGVEHPSFVGQAYLASRLGLNVAEGADLVVRQRRLWLRSLAGLEPIDVLHRRLEGDRIDPMEVNAPGRRRCARTARRRSRRRSPPGQLPRHRRARGPGAGRFVGRSRRLDRRPTSTIGDVEPLRRLSAERRDAGAVRVGTVSGRRRGGLSTGRRSAATRRFGPQDRSDARGQRTRAQPRRRSERTDGGDGEGRLGDRWHRCAALAGRAANRCRRSTSSRRFRPVPRRRCSGPAGRSSGPNS